jgi:hypothetical protein
MEITMIELENIKEFRWMDSFCGFTFNNTNYMDIQLNQTYPYYILGDFTDLNDTNDSGEFF